jgi:arylsulfatase A-like enzyme
MAPTMSSSTIAFVFALAACTPSPRDIPAPRNTERPAIAMDQPVSPAWRALHALGDASFVLPPHNLPDGHPSDGVYELPTGWSHRGTAGHSSLYSRDLPLRLPPKRYRQPPAGLDLRHGERGLDYTRDLDRTRGGEEGWAVIGETLWVSIEGDPGRLDPPLRLVHSATSEQQRRLAFSMAGLPEQEFVSHIATLGQETRSCLLLPAPGSVGWELDLPPGARLQLGLGILPRIDLSLPESDGLEVHVRVNGEELASWEVEVADSFDDVEVDLSRFGGQRVELQLASSTGGDPTGDLALLSAPVIHGASEDVRRVVVVGIDTLRPDHTGVHGYARATSPELDALAEGSYVFDRAYAPAPRTKPSFRSAFTGAYPLPAVHTPTFGQVLSAAGMVTAGFSGNVHLVPRFGFSDGFDLWHYENGAKAVDQVDRAIAWLDRHQGMDSFLFVHIMDPHIFYDAPGRYKNLFVDDKPGWDFPKRYNRWDLDKLQRAGKLGELEKDYVEGRYDGEVRYTSSELGRLFEAIDALPGRTLLVVHTDHGEEFWEHDGFEHNHTLYDEVVRAVLWIRPPGGWVGGPHRVDAQVGLIDIAPTLYDLLGVPRSEWPTMAGSSLAPLLDPARAGLEAETAAALEDRPLHVGYLMYDKERWAVVHRGGKYILHTISGDEELYDLANDATEQRDLVQERADELPAWRERLAQATGWPVGPGLRVHLRGRMGQPLELVFPAPVAEAGVLDPEADRNRRSNLEWGESPKAVPADIATVSLSEDRSRVRVVPGPKPRGTVYVLFGDEVPDGVTLEGEGTSRDVRMIAQNQDFEGNRLELVPGTIIVPKDSMAHRVMAKDADEATMEALKALGYVQ